LTSRALTSALEEVADALDASSNDLAQRASFHRHLVLAGIANASAPHVRGLLALSRSPNNVPPSWILLRTLVEGWIKAQYVMRDSTDSRARSYMLDSLEEQRRFFARLVLLSNRSPAEEMRVLHILGLATRQELDQQLAELSSQIDDVRVRHALKKRVPLNEQARTVGPGAELIYAQIYGFLFSDSAHLGARQAVVGIVQPRPAHTSGDVEKVLTTALSLSQELLEMVRVALSDYQAESRPNNPTRPPPPRAT